MGDDVGSVSEIIERGADLPGGAEEARPQVLFCANPPYFEHMAVAAASLAASNARHDIHVNLITCDRDDAAEDLLRRTFDGLPNLALTVYRADSSTVRDFFVDGFFSKECYLRLFAGDILPESVDRVIYLDCDMVVLDDLDPLWRLDLGENLLAAAPDYPSLPEVTSPARRQELGIPLGHDYVNSGLLVMDLSRWRAEGTSEELARYIERRGALLTFVDQDAINAVLHDRIHLLGCRWNLQARMFGRRRRDGPREYDATVAARRRPAVLHYTGSEKPWLFRSRIPRKGHYVRYWRRTAWSALPQGGTLSLPRRAEFAMDRALSLIGVDYLQLLWILRRAPAKLGEALGLGRRERTRS